jgi:hypothetical protein
MEKHKRSINDSIKSEYPFIKGVNENVECTLCNARFCIANGGLSDISVCLNFSKFNIQCIIDFLFLLIFIKCPGFFREKSKCTFLNIIGTLVLSYKTGKPTYSTSRKNRKYNCIRARCFLSLDTLKFL